GGFVRVTVTTQAPQVTRVSVMVAPASASADLTRDPAGSFSGTLAVPAGNQTVTASVWNGSTLVGTANGSAIVTEGQTANVSIDVPGSPALDHPPAITALTVSSNAVRIGDQVSLAVTAVDADNDPLSFSWSAAPAGCG